MRWAIVASALRVAVCAPARGPRDLLAVDEGASTARNEHATINVMRISRVVLRVIVAATTRGCAIEMSACATDERRQASDAGDSGAGDAATSRDAQMQMDSGSSGPDAVIDSGTVTGSDAAADGAVPADAGAIRPRCQSERPSLPVEVIPSGGVAAFHHLSATCATLQPAFVLWNGGTSKFEVEQITTSPEAFSIETGSLPRTLQPGELLNLKLGFSFWTEVEVEEAFLSVSGPDGCADLPVLLGYAVNDALVSQSAYVLDFGNVAAGTTSEPQEVSFLYQNSTSSLATSEAFEPSVVNGSAPDGTFRLVSVPNEGGEFVRCEERRFRVVFAAPETVGRYDDARLLYLVTTRRPDGIGEGVASVRLYGTSVMP